MKIDKTLISLAVSMAISAMAMNVNADSAGSEAHEKSPVKHVLLISVDGLHQTDLDWFVQNNPTSTLASVINEGVYYKNALTPFPSDSFPGLVGQLTGGNPKSAGIYYDDGYSRGELPLGTSKADCQAKTVALGAEVQYAENIEPTTAGNFMLDATQGISGLYPVKTVTPGVVDSVKATNILKLTSSPDDVRNILIDPAQLPVDPVTCNPVYPHQYLLVNTVFEVAKAAGLRTAWIDKHPAYEILNGPSGYGIDDLFAPEINSVIDLAPSSNDWTKSNINTQQYDTMHLAAVINEINGYDHAGINKHGTPAVFGLNFQSVSTAQKLPKSATPESADPTQLGGYNTVGGVAVPGPVLQSALHFIDDSIKQINAAIAKNPETQDNTVVILSAKHGQSPQKRADLTIINDGTMTDALNAAWAAHTPSDALPLVAHAMDDDGVLLWLNNRSTTATTFAKNFLNNYSGTGIGSDANGVKTTKSFTNAGLKEIYAGVDAANFMGVNPATDQRVPDVIGVAKVGSVYGGGKLSKLAEHGGNSINDRHVPIIGWGATVPAGVAVDSAVSTVQIAPSILALLGLEPEALKAVKLEGTQVLPALKVSE